MSLVAFTKGVCVCVCVWERERERERDGITIDWATKGILGHLHIITKTLQDNMQTIFYRMDKQQGPTV